MSGGVPSGTGYLPRISVGLLPEYRMYILSHVKDTLLSARLSAEGTPNQSIGLVFGTDPTESPVSFSVTMVHVRDGDSALTATNALADAIHDERTGKTGSGVMSGIRDFMQTQVPNGVLMGVYVAYGLNDLGVSYLDATGETLVSGYGVDLVYADGQTVNFVGQQDGQVPMVLSSAHLPVPFIPAPDTGTSDVQFALLRLFNLLTVSSSQLEG